MSPPRTPLDPAAGATDLEAPTAPVVRRAPFSDNPNVGARGQRTQQRILDAALEVFGEEGYQRCRIDRITKRAGCSRASFYQYFSSKEELFHQLTGRVARQLSASTEALGPVGSDAAGRSEISGWVHRYGQIFDRHEPVFRAFNAASESDGAIASGSARWADRNLARVRGRVESPSIPPRLLDPVLELLIECTMRTQHVSGVLRTAVPDDYSHERVENALADVFHRSLFGCDDVNVHPRSRRRPRTLRFDPEMGDVFEQDPFGGLLGGEGAERDPDPGKRNLGRLRRMLPPTHDPELYEL